MSDPFRRLFLDTLELVLKKEPSKESLHELLQLTTPGLEESSVSVSNSSETKKLFRTLISRVHPDKHPTDNERATKLCQDANIFYQQCLVAPPQKKKRKVSMSPRSKPFPQHFKSKEKWPHIDLPIKCDTIDKCTGPQANCLVAYQCINARGAIAHGKRITRSFTSDQALEKAKICTGGREVFRSFGGTKELNSIDEIKEEIMTRGPVVSTSFKPNATFLKHNPTLRCQSEYLIVGWTQEPVGEVWIVSPLVSPIMFVYVSCGQFCVDDCCIAPISSLQDTTWECGPYYDVDMSHVRDNWRGAPTELKFYVPSISKLEPLLKEIGTLDISSGQGQKVCIRDVHKRAHSKIGTLQSIKWVANQWEIVVHF